MNLDLFFAEAFLLCWLPSPGVEIKPLCGLSRFHIGPLWPPVAPADVFIFLSSSPKRRQMFIYNATDKEKTFLRWLFDDDFAFIFFFEFGSSSYVGHLFD